MVGGGRSVVGGKGRGKGCVCGDRERVRELL